MYRGLPLAVSLIFISLIRNVEHIFIYWPFCAISLSLLLILFFFFYCVVHLLLIGRNCLNFLDRSCLSESMNIFFFCFFLPFFGMKKRSEGGEERALGEGDD